MLRISPALAFGAALVAAGSAAASPRLMPTNMPGTMAVEGPVAGFDAVRASAAQREEYGFPPAPDALRHPVAYAQWTRAMHASQRRIVPSLAPNPVRHGAMRPGPVAHSAGASTNWSGTALLSSATGWGPASFRLVGSQISVPQAGQPYGTCSGTWLYSSAWVGLDGAAGYSSDVLQAGLDADSYCSNGQSTTAYDVWYEWAPAYGVIVQNLPVVPGQELYVAVWATSPTRGAAYIVNMDSGAAVSVAINAPAGTALIGNSAEYITERPSIGTRLATLARYTTVHFSSGYTYNNANNAFFAGSPNALQLTMVDNSGNPISAPQVLGGASISTISEGSAQ